MCGGSGGGGNGGRSGGGSSLPDNQQPGEVMREANDVKLAAKMDAADTRLTTKIQALRGEYKRLTDEGYKARTDRKRDALYEQAGAVANKRIKLEKQRTKVRERNPLAAKREKERLDYALMR